VEGDKDLDLVVLPAFTTNDNTPRIFSTAPPPVTDGFNLPDFNIFNPPPPIHFRIIICTAVVRREEECIGMLREAITVEGVIIIWNLHRLLMLSVLRI
jgi:hypothetical protein